MSEHQSAAAGLRGLATSTNSQAVVNGAFLEMNKNGMVYYTADTQNATTATCPKLSRQPVGFTFTIDNSAASGAFTLTPVGETPLVVGDGDTTVFFVTAGGTVKTATYL